MRSRDISLIVFYTQQSRGMWSHWVHVWPFLVPRRCLAPSNSILPDESWGTCPESFQFKFSLCYFMLVLPRRGEAGIHSSGLVKLRLRFFLRV